MDLIPDGENFSAIVTELLDNNIDVIADVGIDNIRDMRTTTAKAIIKREIKAMSSNIAKDIRNKLLLNVNETIQELDLRIEKNERFGRTLHATRTSLLDQRRYVQRELPSLLEGEIKEVINGLTNDEEVNETHEDGELVCHTATNEDNITVSVG